MLLRNILRFCPMTPAGPLRSIIPENYIKGDKLRKWGGKPKFLSEEEYDNAIKEYQGTKGLTKLRKLASFDPRPWNIFFRLDRAKCRLTDEACSQLLLATADILLLEHSSRGRRIHAIQMGNEIFGLMMRGARVTGGGLAAQSNERKALFHDAGLSTVCSYYRLCEAGRDLTSAYKCFKFHTERWRGTLPCYIQKDKTVMPSFVRFGPEAMIHLLWLARVASVHPHDERVEEIAQVIRTVYEEHGLHDYINADAITPGMKGATYLGASPLLCDQEKELFSILASLLPRISAVQATSDSDSGDKEIFDWYSFHCCNIPFKPSNRQISKLTGAWPSVFIEYSAYKHFSRPCTQSAFFPQLCQSPLLTVKATWNQPILIDSLLHDDIISELERTCFSLIADNQPNEALSSMTALTSLIKSIQKDMQEELEKLVDIENRKSSEGAITSLFMRSKLWRLPKLLLKPGGVHSYSVSAGFTQFSYARDNDFSEFVSGFLKSNVVNLSGTKQIALNAELYHYLIVALSHHAPATATRTYEKIVKQNSDFFLFDISLAALMNGLMRSNKTCVRHIFLKKIRQLWGSQYPQLNSVDSIHFDLDALQQYLSLIPKGDSKHPDVELSLSIISDSFIHFSAKLMYSLLNRVDLRKKEEHDFELSLTVQAYWSYDYARFQFYRNSFSTRRELYSFLLPAIGPARLFELIALSGYFFPIYQGDLRSLSFTDFEILKRDLIVADSELAFSIRDYFLLSLLRGEAIDIIMDTITYDIPKLDVVLTGEIPFFSDYAIPYDDAYIATSLELLRKKLTPLGVSTTTRTIFYILDSSFMESPNNYHRLLNAIHQHKKGGSSILPRIIIPYISLVQIAAALDPKQGLALGLDDEPDANSMSRLFFEFLDQSAIEEGDKDAAGETTQGDMASARALKMALQLLERHSNESLLLHFTECCLACGYKMPKHDNGLPLLDNFLLQIIAMVKNLGDSVDVVLCSDDPFLLHQLGRNNDTQSFMASLDLRVLTSDSTVQLSLGDLQLKEEKTFSLKSFDNSLWEKDREDLVASLNNIDVKENTEAGILHRAASSADKGLDSDIDVESWLDSLQDGHDKTQDVSQHDIEKGEDSTDLMNITNDRAMESTLELFSDEFGHTKEMPEEETPRKAKRQFFHSKDGTSSELVGHDPWSNNPLLQDHYANLPVSHNRLLREAYHLSRRMNNSIPINFDYNVFEANINDPRNTELLKEYRKAMNKEK